MIKFPKVHIAESVVNRILAVADGMPDLGPERRPVESRPMTPNLARQSMVLDETLAEPVSGALPPLESAPDPGGTMTGRPLLDTLVNPDG